MTPSIELTLESVCAAYAAAKLAPSRSGLFSTQANSAGPVAALAVAHLGIDLERLAHRAVDAESPMHYFAWALGQPLGLVLALQAGWSTSGKPPAAAPESIRAAYQVGREAAVCMGL